MNGVKIVAKQQGKRPAGKGTGSQPITRHPLFPAIVALWFGALFGLGSLAIRPALLEAFVLKFHIDLLVPAAAPPLGVTARILFSMALAVVGGCIGAIVSRSLTRPKAEPRERKRTASAAAARDEVRRYAAYVSADPDPYGLQQEEAEQPVPAGRRRALAIDEDYGPVYHHEMAPLPGGAPQILDVTDFDFVQAQDAAEAAAAAAPAGALDLSGFLSSEEQTTARDGGEKGLSMNGDFSAVDGMARRGFDAPAQPAVEQPAFAQPAFAQPVFEQPVFEQPAPAAPAFAPPAQQFAAAPAWEAPVQDEAEFAPPPAYVPPLGVAPAEPLDLGQPLDLGAPEAAAPVAAASPAAFIAPTGEVAERIASAALEMLSQVELIERLALSLQRRRAAEAQPVVAAPAPAPAPAFAEPAPFAAPQLAPFAAPQPAAFAAPQPEMPAAMRPVSLDIHEAEDDDFSSLLPPRQFAMPVAESVTPAPVAAAPAASEDEEDLLADGYSSLLGLSRPAPRAEFVRVDEPEDHAGAIEPVVVFPGQALRAAVHAAMPASMATPPVPPVMPSVPVAAVAAPAEGADPARRFDGPATANPAAPAAAPASYAPVPAHDREEAERALRTALSTLQRMSATG